MVTNKLDKYAEFVGEDYIHSLREACLNFDGKTMAHVNSTYYGGGVAEMLNSYIPLLNEAGLETEWRLLKGDRDFFTVTKKLHNSLQGMKVNLDESDIESYEETLDNYSEFTKLGWYDMVIIDDPQPCGLITRYNRHSPSFLKPLPNLMKLIELQKKQPWVWRCHIDLTKPDIQSWNFMKKYVEKYDSIIVSTKDYAVPVNKPHFFVPPAIDPLSDKNKKISDSVQVSQLEKYDIKDERPLILQVSRFDHWKDPLGVIEVYKKLKKKIECQLVLIGSMASDDPEGELIFNQAFRAAEKERHVHLITAQDDILVNTLQRRADVVLQKSLREGFGLTVSEAMWKGTPVVASNVGGIPLQIDNDVNGYLVNGIDDCANKVGYLLTHSAKARELGRNGIEKVRRNFLITRLIRDEIDIFNNMTSTNSRKIFNNQKNKLTRSLNDLRKLVPIG